MYARVVRFTEVDPDHLAGRLAEIESSDGPPVDIPAKGIQILHDPDQGTAVVIQLFETADDMAAAEGPLEEMDPAGRAPPSTAARSRPSWGRGDRLARCPKEPSSRRGCTRRSMRATAAPLGR